MKRYKLANLNTGDVISFNAKNDVEADFRCAIEIELRNWDISRCICREVKN
jgi:hypothetical protein